MGRVEIGLSCRSMSMNMKEKARPGLTRTERNGDTLPQHPHKPKLGLLRLDLQLIQIALNLDPLIHDKPPPPLRLLPRHLGMR